MPSEQPFDLDEWLDSIDGQTVKITAPAGLGGEANRLYSSTAATRGAMTLCPQCEDMRLLIDDGDLVGTCPVCGYNPRSLLALGTQSKVDWEQTPEGEKPDV